MPTLLRMPAIAAGAETAVLSEWQVQEGVPFNKSDAIATVETDKAMVDMEAEDAGVILRFLVGSGEQVEVGAVIALSGTPGEAVDDIEAALRELGVQAASPSSNGSQPSSEKPNSSDAPTTVLSTHGGRVFATPLVRRLARDADLDLGAVSGTGPNGRIVRRDVEALLTQTSAPGTDATPAEPAEAHPPATDDNGDRGFRDVPHTRIRAAIAARLTGSKRDTPHFYLRGTCRVDSLQKMRAELNAAAENTDGPKVSVNDLIIKAAARAHTIVPAMNVVWTQDAVRRFDAVDIAVAVATNRGLLTPVVRDAARRSLSAVSADMSELAERARLGTLAQREIEGGSFCISNLGMYGTEEFSAIINPPQSAILAVGAALSEPVVQDGELAVATVMRVTLSVDHRPIDGSIAAEWMRTFVGIVESPLQILL
ncbi:dihydrolipoamide acetyltransferase family protein [Mycolicibacterium moriokaense]|uniref:Dihydrolipoamide acetyltransferase component of pyruvate dehydrogenase complex n=1 Tax=Mycolicibacterium moriokaense TaxID=39691 RepID=A0A318HBL4_9MYCO|nr:dihydrolipoamide acetyltransferase family protein [Mycolicibacterium moriokaense]PXW96481.1 pyruvate dehydrogenase E2 component (dihydrolipoamide acetyltransferase) [Mycolicibacterium moriokaense]